MPEHHPIIIIGAGLSGLYCAWQLQQNNQDCLLLDARARCGGRILSHKIGETADSHIDMGPAWVWPQLQPRLSQLLKNMQLSVFPQFTQGDILYQQAAQKIQRYSTQSSHSQSYRISGGVIKLIEALESQLSNNTLLLHTRVKAINLQAHEITTLQNNTEVKYHADKLVLALPPRLALDTIQFTPSLDKDISSLWKSTPTWMASHAKFAASYDSAFWREQGFSGEVFSHAGPMGEIYDASPQREEQFALTSFLSLSPQQRATYSEEEITQLCVQQLVSLFGESAKNYTQVFFKDWSQDSLTASELDVNTPAHHPEYSHAAKRNLYDDFLFLAGTELARQHGGYLEGALESVDDILQQLL